MKISNQTIYDSEILYDIRVICTSSYDSNIRLFKID